MEERGDIPPAELLDLLRFGIFGHDSEAFRCGKNATLTHKDNITFIHLENEDAEYDVEIIHPKKISIKDFLHQRFQ